MARFDFDLFVIGAGSGGVRASRVSASLGARVAVAEERYLGGTCVNVGCIPKKLLVYASHCADDFEDAAGYGWTVGPRSFDWASLIANKDREIARLNSVYARLLDDAGVRRIDARARIRDAHTVEAGGKTYTAEHLLVATGGWPRMPAIPGIEHAISSNEAFHLKELPRRVVIAGGGYIAVEFAGIFAGLGARVTLAHRGELFLRGFDDDLRRGLAAEMAKRGVELRFGVQMAGIERTGAGLRAVFADGGAVEADQVMFAIGRDPNAAGLGLENAGVALGRDGAVVVDAYSRTSVASVFAIGDVTNRLNLTPVAIHEAMAFARTVFGGAPTPVNYADVPSAVFSQPQIGAVGLTELEAAAQFGAIDVYRSSFRALRHTLTGRDEQTIMKLVVDRASQRVLGAHMLGPDAGEIIQGIAIAVKCRATKAQFDATVGIHPTAAEEFVTMRTPVAPS
ncbi:MAG: glutathione-disulfide reductase [Myxococcota bacterium]